MFRRISPYAISVEGKNKKEIIVYISEELEKDFDKEALSQLENISCLPGVVSPVLGMPDIHWGYGFPIGGVAAFDVDRGGIISPGGVGFDINCGVRLLRTNLQVEEVRPNLDALLSRLFSDVPAGLGKKAGDIISKREFSDLLIKGARWVVEQGWGIRGDLDCCEEQGAMPDADPSVISRRAIERGREQVGSLGSGNHFLELQEVVEVFDSKVAGELGIFQGQLVVMVHTGSRGFGHQVCSDFVKEMLSGMRRHGISVPDKQLACAPFYSEEGQRYWKAMCCAANYAWANRQMLTHLIRSVFEQVFGECWRSLGMDLVYDVAHNIAKLERYKVEGRYRTLCVHRKGATRAFGPGNQALPEVYKKVGQPVIVPGDMGTASYLLLGTDLAMERSFGSCCHGAGRLLSRRQAIRDLEYNSILSDLQTKGISLFSHSRRGVLEEAPAAYKDVDKVVETVVSVGLARLVARMRPLGVIKG